MAATKWSETAMLVVDMQKDFVSPDTGSPMVLPGAEVIVPTVIEAVSAARDRGILVIWVVREHDPWGRDVEPFRRHLYANGKGPAVKGRSGAELVEGLVIKDEDYKVVKTRFSAFLATNLHQLLQGCGIKDLVVIVKLHRMLMFLLLIPLPEFWVLLGVKQYAWIQTPNCVRQTVFDAVALDYRQVTVIADATTTAVPQVHLDNIRDMKNIGVATPTLQEWLQL